ncbi:hypothetical protein EFM18_06220 [Limosilactobacillus fermentum]|nr:hypothetical protein [Limosilactobacillus fermentum]
MARGNREKVFDKDDTFRIIIGKSRSERYVSSIRSDEGEILFPRGTRFKVVKYYQDENGKNIIEVEEVE